MEVEGEEEVEEGVEVEEGEEVAEVAEEVKDYVVSHQVQQKWQNRTDNIIL